MKIKPTYVQPQIEVVNLEADDIQTNENSALLPFPDDWKNVPGTGI